MDFSTLRPIDYTISQPQITPMAKRMSDVLTLADMMDKAKIQKMQIADAERKQAAQEAIRQEALAKSTAFEAPFTAPDTSEMYKAITTAPLTDPSNRVAIHAIGGFVNPGSPEIGNVSPNPNFRGPVQPMAAQPPSAFIPTLEGFQAQPEIAPIVAQRKQQEAGKEIPKGYQWMQPDEYSHFIKAQTIDPEYADQYKKDLIDQKYKLAQTQTQESKAKELEDYMAGSVIKALGPTATPDAITNALVTAGMDPVKARSYADTAPAVATRFEMSKPALAAKQAELVAQKAKEEKEFKDKQEERANKLLELQQRSANRADAKSLLEMKKLQGEIDAANATKSGTEYDASNLVSAIEEAKNHPGFAVGANPKRLVGLVPGTPVYDFVNLHGNILNQIALMGRSKLKGQGQVSDYEGKMLKAAMSRLSLDMSPQAYKKELDRLEKYVGWRTSNPDVEIKSEEQLRNVMGGQSIQPAGSKILQFNPVTGKVE